MVQTQAAFFAIPYVPLLPLIGSLFAYVAGRNHKDHAGVIATAASALAFVLVAFSFNNFPETQVIEANLFNWFSAGNLSVDFALRFDHLTAVMCLVITGVGTLIHLYSIAYMHEDEGRHRFFAYLNLFMFSMLLLVMGANLLVMFVGWEGVGLCSYLLIGFWYTNPKYADAGMKAFVVNRIGDAGFLLGIFLIIWNFGTVDFAALRPIIAAHSTEVSLCTAIALCLFVGATGKSAQIPLFVWLPDAMAGPTPVSALIHAATMVTAGVYMMARLNFLFALAPFALAVVLVVALVTAVVSATTAIAQNDIKKVLAYSTVSQLGFMFLAAGAGAYWVAVFHLVTHAFFKACLFLGAGSVIHGCHHEQDMRKMGGLVKYMPVTAFTYGVSVLAIAGLFPFAGYQSKHAILHALESNPNPFLGEFAELLPVIATITACLTAFYMTRSFAMTFLGKYRGHAHPHESPVAMTLPLLILAVLATVGGLWLNDHLPVYLSTVIPLSEHGHAEGLVEAFHNSREHLMSSWVGILGIVLALLMYTNIIPFVKELPRLAYSGLRPLSALFEGKYFFDEIYQALIISPLAWLSRLLWKVVDQGMIDGSVNGTGQVMEFGGETIRVFQTGQIRHYAFFMLCGAVALIGLYLVTF